MTCAQIEAERWRLSFSDAEATFLISILARLARHYQSDLDEMPAAVRAYWQGRVSASDKPLSPDLKEAQEMLSESRAELRSDRLALVQNWIREYEIAEDREPWQVELTSAERDEFVAMLNDRRLTLALELGISDADMEIEPSHIPQDARRAAILEIDVLGHFVLVTIGPQISSAMTQAAASTLGSAPLPDLSAAFNRADFDGYIFDCDGTLADSMPLHYRAWSESLSGKLGRPATEFTEALFYHFGGMPARHIVERLNQDYGWNLPVEKTAHEKELDFIKLLPGVGPVPEVIAVLESLGKKAKVVVASGGLTSIVEDTLWRVGIESGPDHIVKRVIGSDQVKRGKPSPDLFLHAAEVLGVVPSRCLVFEDAEPGFKAAQAAGMRYIDVRSYRRNISPAARY